MPRLISTTAVPHLGHCAGINGKAAILKGVAVLLSSTFVFARICFANETILESGISVGEKTSPFVRARVSAVQNLPTWDLSLTSTARADFESGLGDVSVDLEATAETMIVASTTLTLDASYAYLREKSDAIDQTHDFGADVGLETDFDYFTLNVDAGAFMRLHADTAMAGSSGLDRHHEDFTEFENAARLALNTGSVNPFIEVAILHRAYIANNDRNFFGPDLVLGATLSTENLKGDIGVIVSERGSSALGAAFVVGPYVDVKWNVGPETVLAFDFATALDQDTTGAPNLFPVFSSDIALSQSISDTLKVTARLQSSLERRKTGAVVEITPALKVDMANPDGPGFYASVSAVVSREGRGTFAFAPAFEVGMKWVM